MNFSKPLTLPWPAGQAFWFFAWSCWAQPGKKVFRNFQGPSPAGLRTSRTAWLRVWLAWLCEVGGEASWVAAGLAAGPGHLWCLAGSPVLHCDFPRRHQRSQEPVCKSLHGCQGQHGRVILAEHCHGTGGTCSSPLHPFPGSVWEQARQLWLPVSWHWPLEVGVRTGST